MLSKILDTLREQIGYTTVIIILGLALFTLLYDGPRYMKKGFVREVRIIKAIAYSYIAIGGIIYILLLIR